MTRAERLERLEALLVRRGSATAAELAAALAVSVRTLHRDIASLRERHVPVSSGPGPGGGFRVDARYATMNVRLRNDEIVALWLGAELARRASAFPWTGGIGSALDRIFASLPDGRRRELRAMLRRVVVGEPATEAMRLGAKPPAPELVACFEEAFTSRRGLAFDYVDREGRASRRAVEPHGLLLQPPVWYVLAFDPEKGEPRMFRMDRIAKPRVARDMSFTPRQEVVDALKSVEAWEAWVQRGRARGVAAP